MDIFFVFVAGVFNQLSAGLEVHYFGGGPGLGVGFGIVDGGLDLEVSEVAAVDAFGYVQGVCGGMAGLIEPSFAVETGGVDDERVAVPLAGGVAEPGGVGVLSKLAAIHEDLAIQVEGFVKDQDNTGFLIDPKRIWGRINSGESGGQAVGLGFLAGVNAGAALGSERRSPGLHRQLAGLEIRGKIDQVLGRGDLPDSGEIRLAVGAVRRGRGKIGFAIIGAGYDSGGEFRPLRGG